MLDRIISGGQTGVDRAALDWAIAVGIPHGGYCPRGRRAEDGVIPPRYHLEETRERTYKIRTRMNVEESDGTAIITAKPVMTGGTRLTAEIAAELGRPLIHLHSAAPEELALRLMAFIEAEGIRRLNVAGPRASQSPEAAKRATAILTALGELMGV